jgi:hypothetical protein
VEFWGAAIDRDRRRRERELAIVVRAASKYDKEQFEEFLKD